MDKPRKQRIVHLRNAANRFAPATRKMTSEGRRRDSLVAHPRTVSGMFCFDLRPQESRRCIERHGHRPEPRRRQAPRTVRWIDQEFTWAAGKRPVSGSFDIRAPRCGPSQVQVRPKTGKIVSTQIEKPEDRHRTRKATKTVKEVAIHLQARQESRHRQGCTQRS